MIQVISISVVLICTACLSNPLFAASAMISDTTQADSIRKAEPDFKNVNVLVETEWGTTDKRDAVDVYVKMKGKKPVEIEMMKDAHEKCSITLMPGVIVKIFDPKSGRLLKKY